MKTATLAAAIQRDLLRTELVRAETPTCYACGRPLIPQPSTGDDNTHAFCSARCREAYEAGFPAYDPDQFRELARTFDTSKFRVVARPPDVTTYNPLQGSERLSRGIKRRGSAGWVIECFGCGKEFHSEGLRCCSAKCERDCRRRFAGNIWLTAARQVALGRELGGFLA
jgi:hypothetical protein